MSTSQTRKCRVPRAERSRSVRFANALVIAIAIAAGYAAVEESLSAQASARTDCVVAVVDILGTEGDDVLFGTPGPDTIQGLGGNDLIFGLGGDDTICGGRGDDTIRGGSGNDTLIGDFIASFEHAGHDILLGDAGNDLLMGDVVDAGPPPQGMDRLTGGDDLLDGGPGVDNLFGDVLGNGPGPDILQGGNDSLLGGPDGDFLLGDNIGAGAEQRRCALRWRCAAHRRLRVRRQQLHLLHRHGREQ